MAKRGRKNKHYVTTWGETIVGLYRAPDGRWRHWVTNPDTGERKEKKFTEPDEKRAISRFRAVDQPLTVDVPQTFRPTPLAREPVAIVDHSDGHAQLARLPQDAVQVGEIVVERDPYWATVRIALCKTPAYVAAMTGVEEVARLEHLPKKQPALTLTEILKTYMEANSSSDRTKKVAKGMFEHFMAYTKAKTVADLTTASLLAFRNHIESSKTVKSVGSRRQIYGKIKTVLSFGKREGLDPVQIDAVLQRCDVLRALGKKSHPTPSPMSREHFHQLRVHADAKWRAMLLVQLNLCLSTGEVGGLQWAHLDLDRGIYATYRAKTMVKRIPRAAVLWPETIAALKEMPRKVDTVFLSSHATRFSAAALANGFARLRKAANLPTTVQMNQIRDAAYTAAIADPASSENAARVLAGHRAPGQQDHYVLRSPEITKPACDAVYKAFAPFEI